MAMYKMFSMNIDDAIEMSEKLFKEFENAASPDEDRFVPIMISRPGVGKSSTVAKMAKRMGYDLIDLNLSCLEPTDVVGLGAREKVGNVWQTMPALPQWAERAFEGNCIIFVDEFNNTTQDVLSGFQKMFSDFVIDGRKLPRTTHIVGACNPPGVDAIYAAKKLSGAFRRRLCIIPIIDDFSYVMKKHDFTLPKNYVDVDYDDISEYCSYDQISSAVIDNVFNISKYDTLTPIEQLSLINGFGQGALKFAQDHDLVSDELIASGKNHHSGNVTEGEWLKDPYDVIEEYQQILWGQARIARSSSYSRSKGFISKVENPRVYSTLMAVLKEKFDAEYLSDITPLPDTRD